MEDMTKIAVIQNVSPNDHHTVFTDGFVRELDRTRFSAQLFLQKTNDEIQFRDIDYGLRLIPGKTYSPLGQLHFTMGSFRPLRSFGPDIVHALNPFSSIIAPMLLRKHGVPKVIYDVRGLWVEFGIHAGYFPPMLGRAILEIDTFLMKRCDYLIAISPLMKKILIRKGIPEDKIGVVSTGVDLDKFDSANRFDYYKHFGWDGHVIGYIASISTARASQDVLYAFKSALESLKKTDIYLAMIGPVYQPEYFQDLVDELGLSNNVRFTDFVPHKRIPEYIKGLDWALSYFPETDREIDNVRVPTKLLEYMAAGKPTIVTDQICHTSIVQDRTTAVVVNPDVESLAKGIVDAVEDPALRYIGRNAREHAEEYSFKRIAHKMESIYSLVLD